jgi:hypothetical protein
MIFDIVQGRNTGRANAISTNRLENFFPEIERGEKSKVVKALLPTPGYTLAVEAYSEGTGRGIYTTSTGRLFTVVYNKLIEISTADAATERGTLSTSINHCVMADNGTQIMIVDGTYGYIYNLSTNALTTITDTDFPSNPVSVVFTDGYFLVSFTDSGQFYFSASYDGTDWDALDFATAEYSADSLQGIAKTSNGTIWMIGKRSLEQWSNVGTVDLPWRRIEGSVKEIGCVAPYSIASNGSQVFWLGNGENGYGSVFMGSGYDVQKITTPAEEYKIKQFTNIDEAVGFTYSDEGHSFYVISFSSEATLCYDLTTGEWHNRGSYNSLTGNNIRQFANGHAFFNGKNYIGSYSSGNVYTMSIDYLDEDGTGIKRVIQTNHIFSENKRLYHRRLELDLEKGVAGAGEDSPNVMLQFSDDGGNTWSSEHWASAGSIGEYSARVVWRRLGSSRDRVYRITFSASVKWYIVNAFIEAD